MTKITLNQTVSTMTTLTSDTMIEIGKSVISTEAETIKRLMEKIDDHFIQACQLMLHCKGHVITLGLGKSGHIARKIAATLASSGTPAFFIHAGEANHGDLGMMTDRDVLIVTSYSGNTQEIINLLPKIQQLNIPIIAITGNRTSLLAKLATTTIHIQVQEEACSLGIIPTASTTATLVMGDALAITLLKLKNFTEHDFANNHPGGSLGLRLSLQVKDIMHTEDAIPIVDPDCLLDEALVEITRKSCGMTIILNHEGHLLGIFTDGDLRQALDQGYDIHHTRISDVMTKTPITVPSTLLVTDALNIMRQHKIKTLLVLNDKKNNIVQGLVHLYDIIRSSII